MRIVGIITTPHGHRADALLRPALGRPLLAYCAHAALASRRLSRVVLSTRHPAVAAAAEELGLELGPPPLPEPTVPQLQTIVAALEQEEGRRCDAVMLLPANYPLRTAHDIDGAIELLERTGADAVASFVPRRPSTARLAGIDGEGRVLARAEDGADLPARTYIRDGSLSACRRAALMEQGQLEGADCRAWLLPPERHCAVEDDFDLYLLEQLLRYPRRATA